MASTRESSPVLSDAGSPSAVQLTPTSKVKAMLAAFDDDSDEEAVTKVQKSRPASAVTSPPTKSPISNGNSKPSEEREAEAAKNTESSSDEEAIVRPKGRMASRMQAEQVTSEDDDEPVDARARVRKLLATKSKSPTPAAHSEANNEDEESDAPVVSRKRKIRQRRQATPKSSPAKESGSPSLFVSPTKDKSGTSAPDGSDSENLPEPEDLVHTDRFKALVAQKRQEREVRDAEAAKEKATKLAERKRYTEMMQEDDDSDGEGGRRLTQQTRGTRKASKRAIDEINKESQRLSRNQQLAHQATTKKKFTKSDFFSKFKFRDAEQNSDAAVLPRPSSSSSAAPHSDMETKDTPPTSPVSPMNAKKELHVVSADEPAMTSSPPRRLDKGKGKAVEQIEEPISEVKHPKKPLFTQRPIRVRPPKAADRTISLDDSDSDLEIVKAKTPKLKQRLDTLFDNVPAKQSRESNSLLTLRMLAHLGSPGKQNTGRNKQKPSVTTTELELSLHQRARQQAAKEREERLDALRAKGIVIQTAEEREKEMVDVDDILAAARREQEELAKREKAAAKKERKDNGEVDPLGDSSDDEDWEEPKDVPEEELSVSGSEDEGENESANDAAGESDGEEDEDAMAVDDEEEENAVSNPMFDNEAESGDDEEEAEASADEEMADEDDEEQLPAHRRTRNANVISDDEDEEQDDNTSPSVPQLDTPHLKTDSPVAPHSVLRSATKTFIPGLTVAGPAGLGLTQIFAGTMDESQLGSYDASQIEATQPDAPTPSRMNVGQDPMSFLKRIQAPDLPPFIPTMSEDTQDVDEISPSQTSHIPESQPTQTQAIDLHFSQSQVHEFDSMVQDDPAFQFEATQDVGFAEMTPIKGRFMEMPPSTIDTVILERTDVPETLQETPIVKKKGKLRRRAPQIASFSDDEEETLPGPEVEEEDAFSLDADAFDVLRKASKKKVVVEEFNKKESKAKEMVHDQAEESEDEYAGLGGASDDESGGEEDAYVKEMIDDKGGEAVDDGKLAAFYADRERANDEKQVEKLFKDITNGNLRRKRGGADLDLSDSDDGGEAKKRRKRKEFARMRKALLADERIGKIAANPKKEAFLKAIEDRGSEDEMDFLDDFAEQDENMDSQSQSQAEGSQQVVPDSQPTDMGPPKRKRSDDANDAANRPPPHLRRTKPAKKPTNLSEIRQSLSSLIEEPNAITAPVDSGPESDDDLEIEDEHDLGPGRTKEKENRDPFALRRTDVKIVDRIQLKRESSSTVSTSSKLAFQVSSASSGFKVPALLRRATTNSSITSTTSSVGGGMSATERMAGGAASEGVRRGGSKGSGIHSFARESERREAMAKREGKRVEKKMKGAKARAKVVGGLFGGGSFE